VAGLAVVALMLLPGRANGQFGIDIAAIMAALSKVESLMSTYVAAPLKTINQAQQTVASMSRKSSTQLRQSIRPGTPSRSLKTSSAR